MAEEGSLPADLSGEDALRAMIARGLGVEDVPAERDELLALLASGRCVPALPFELVFPEVFFPTGDLADRHGFHAKLGNPPWDTFDGMTTRILCGMIDIGYLDPSTRREKASIKKRLLSNPDHSEAYDIYISDLLAQRSNQDRLYSVHKARVNGELAGRGTYDAYVLFAERARSLFDHGVTGFGASVGFSRKRRATGVRRLYLERWGWSCCYSFENRRKLVRDRQPLQVRPGDCPSAGSNRAFRCAFYLHDDEWLFGEGGDREALVL